MPKLIARYFKQFRWVDLPLNLAVVAIYLLFAKIGLILALKSPAITIFWPAGGFALAVLLLGGLRFLPGIFVGAVVAGLIAVMTPWVATGLGVADTLESIVAWWVLTRACKFNLSLDNRQDYFKLAIVASTVASAVSAVIGPGTLLINQLITLDQFPLIAMRWWMGDVLGIAFITPLILAWSRPPLNPVWTFRRWEMAALFIVAFIVGQIDFFGWFENHTGVNSSIAWVIPLVIWAGLRAGRRRTALLQLMLFGQALWSAGHGIGQYADEMVKSDLIDFWMFGITMAVGGMAMAVTIAENRRSQRLLRENEQLLSESQHLAHIGGWSWTDNTEMIRCTDETYRIFGVTPDRFEPTPANFMKLIHPDDQQKMKQWLRACLDGQQPERLELRLPLTDGNLRILQGRGKLQAATNGMPRHLIGTVQDITERKKLEQEIYNLAFYDVLTRLPNRRLFLDRFSAALSASARHHNYGAILFLDMDNFKILNDNFGHDYGDLLLKEVGVRIRKCVREMDTVARYGGDEFVVLIEDVSQDETDASHKVVLVAEKIREALAQPYKLKRHKHQSTPSIGISLFHGNQESIDTLLMQADIAMYQAKSGGRNAVRFFKPDMQRSLRTEQLRMF
ncbi:MAG: diguanylate cyclase [Gallionella sp.]